MKTTYTPKSRSKSYGKMSASKPVSKRVSDLEKTDCEWSETDYGDDEDDEEENTTNLKKAEPKPPHLRPHLLIIFTTESESIRAFDIYNYDRIRQVLNDENCLDGDEENEDEIEFQERVQKEHTIRLSDSYRSVYEKLNNYARAGGPNGLRIIGNSLPIKVVEYFVEKLDRTFHVMITPLFLEDYPDYSKQLADLFYKRRLVDEEEPA